MTRFLTRSVSWFIVRDARWPRMIVASTTLATIFLSCTRETESATKTGSDEVQTRPHDDSAVERTRPIGSSPQAACVELVGKASTEDGETMAKRFPVHPTASPERTLHTERKLAMLFQWLQGSTCGPVVRKESTSNAGAQTTGVAERSYVLVSHGEESRKVPFVREPYSERWRFDAYSFVENAWYAESSP